MNPLIALEDIRIAKPCRADWERMTGDERTRFCGSCHKNVYDLSQLTREQAHQLIAETEGEVCVRLYRRPDGTVLTSDCPVGRREVTRPLWWSVAGFVALLAAGVGVFRSSPATAPAHTFTPWAERARQWPLFGTAVNLISPAPAPPMMGAVGSAPTMGNSTSVWPAPSVTMGAPLPVMGEFLLPTKMPTKPTTRSAPAKKPKKRARSQRRRTARR